MRDVTSVANYCSRAVFEQYGLYNANDVGIISL